MIAPDRLALSEPLDGADVPAAELVAKTRRQEARTAMATVDTLIDHGVPVRDIAVITRHIERYEAPLFRAAIQYGITPTVWTQLHVTQTRPYALVEAICDALAEDTLTPETLCRPLELRWSPPSSTSTSSSTPWPIEPETVQAALEALPDTTQSVAAWREEIASIPHLDDRFITYTEQLDAYPDPDPAAVSSVLVDVIEAYEEHGLQKTKAADSPALIETERDTRALRRVKTLIQSLQHKYADRLDEGTLDRAWSAVADLSQLMATQRPGRQEHSNARALDIIESNDSWLLDIPYIVIVGLVDGEWPAHVESVLPPEFQEAVLKGNDQVGTLAPRTAWSNGRDRDQFDDAVRAASRGVILTRHTETIDGEQRRPSTLIDYLDTTVVSDQKRKQLVSPDRVLPDAIREMIDCPEDYHNE